MSHVVLARKYRPRSFEQMVGQGHVVQALGNALTSGRLHHAYLFTGTRGIGKTTVSRILAKSLNCTGPDGTGGVTARPCGVCQACTEIDADRFIDYIELDAASNRGIDEVRDLIERAAYKPSVGRFKVFMIDEAHQLTKEAFNALLKTLEEPPDYLKFVLATTDPEKMLPTVLSRCLQFNLRPMAPETVQQHLQQIVQAEGVAADAGALRLLSRAARGSMRDALSLTDQAIAYGAGALDEAGVRAMLGTVDRGHAAALVGALAVRDGAAVLATVDGLRALGLSAAGTLEEMAALLQQMAVAQAVPGALDETDPDSAAARTLAAGLPADETQLLYSIVVHGRAELSLLSDEYAALTMVLLRLLAFLPSGAAPGATPGAAAAAGVAGPATAARAAPLVAAVREARSSAPARLAGAAGMPVPAPVPLPVIAPPASPAAAPPPASPEAAPPPAPLMAAPAQPAPVAKFSPPDPPRVVTARELPPWLDDAVPDDDSLAGPRDGPGPGTDAGAQTDSASPPIEGSTPARVGPRPVAAGLLPFEPTVLGTQWAALIRPLVAAGSVAAMVRELALQAQPLGVVAVADADGGGRCWQLCAERETLRTPVLVAKLAAAMQAALGEPVRLDVQAGVAQDSIARRDALAREATQREAEHSVTNHPSVRGLLAQFRSARIVPGSIKPLTADPREPRTP